MSRHSVMHFIHYIERNSSFQLILDSIDTELTLYQAYLFIFYSTLPLYASQNRAGITID